MGTAPVDFQLKDDGTAVATATPLDKAGNPATLQPGEVPQWSSDNAAVVVDGSGDPSGLTAKLTPSGGLAVGVNISVSLVITNADGTTTTLSGSAPVDVVGTTASGFSIAIA